MILRTDRLTHRQLLDWTSDPTSLCPDCDADAGEDGVIAPARTAVGCERADLNGDGEGDSLGLVLC